MRIKQLKRGLVSLSPLHWPFGKDADPDIPILKEAKTEYAKLQQAGFGAVPSLTG
jgi:hypothetical protein